MEFIESLYNSKYFMLGLSVVIVILIILFLVILLSGKKKTEKVVEKKEETPKEEELISNMVFNDPNEVLPNENYDIKPEEVVTTEMPNTSVVENKLPFEETPIPDSMAFSSYDVPVDENPVETARNDMEFEPFPTFNDLPELNNEKDFAPEMPELKRETPSLNDEMPTLKKDNNQFSSVYINNELPAFSSPLEKEPEKSKVEERISFVVEDELPKLNDENKM